MRQREEGLVATDADSRSTRIAGSEKKSLTGAWLTVLLPLGILAWFMGWAHMPFFMGPGIPNPIVGVLGLFAVLALGRAVWETVRLKRFGDPALDLTQVPVPLGGAVEGRIDLGSGVTAAPDFKLKLQCIRMVLQQGAKNSRWVETPLWTGETTVSLLPGGMLPVSMAVPPDQLETSSDDAFNRILWRLTVQAPFRGIAFLEKYEIPVEGRTSAAQAIAEKQEGSRAMERAATPVTRRKLFVSTLPFLAVGLAIAVGGCIVLRHALDDLKQAGASAAWPTVRGRITQSFVEEGKNSAPSVVYTYAVNGTVYMGETIYPHWLWTHSSSQRMVAMFPRHAMVTVHYAPSNPAQSCLTAGYRPGVFQRLLAALGIFDLAFLFGSVAIFAPLYGEMSGNTITYKKGSPASKAMGWSLVLILVLGLATWLVT